MQSPLFPTWAFLLFMGGMAGSMTSRAQSPELARAEAAHQSLRQATSEADRLALHAQIEDLWAQAAEAGGLMDVDWSLWNEAVVDLGEGEERLLVYSWNVELDDQSQRYGGWVAVADSKAPLGYQWTALAHDTQTDPTDDNRIHRHDHWQGGLYYAGVVTYDKSKPVYTVLAWDGADALTTRKWAETLETRNGRVRFGSPRFEMPQGLRKRHVLRYANAVQATLRVESSPVRIVMDHLAPESPDFRGQYAFYGPTLSYDALEWRKGRWHWKKDVAAQNDEEGSRREYRDPSRRRGRN